MITNDNELRLTRERLQLAEAALDSLRRDLLPVNEVQYRLFSAAPIELIRSIRDEIDLYLGIAPDSELVISLEGNGVSLGQTLAGAVTHIIDAFRRGLRLVVGAVDANSRHTGEDQRDEWLDRVCDLPLAGVGPGSVRVFLDLPPLEGPFTAEDDQLLNDAITVLFDGLEWAGQGEDAPAPLEKLHRSARLAILGAVAQLLPPQSGPVERIVYQRRPGGPGKPQRRATLTRQSRQRVQGEMERLAADARFTEAEGVIRQVDLDAQTFVLRERPGDQPDLPCEYASVLADIVKGLLDCRVKVSGLLETSRMTQRSKLEAEAIEPLPREEEIGKKGSLTAPSLEPHG
jgi:hypothetical protein